MEKVNLALIFIGVISLTSYYQRIGDITMVSNRNIDSGQHYELSQRNVTVKAKKIVVMALEKSRTLYNHICSAYHTIYDKKK